MNDAEMVSDAIEKATAAVHGPLNALTCVAPNSWSALHNYDAAEGIAKAVLDAVGYDALRDERDALRAERDRLREERAARVTKEAAADPLRHARAALDLDASS